jgi:hypothetical protein
MELNENFEVEETATERGMKWFGRVLAIIIVLVVSAFGDVMYISMMSDKFPSGFLLVLCYAGAFTSFLAVIYMLVGKSVLFTPGPQMVTAWFAFSIELMLIALNICLVVAGASAGGFLAVWNQVAPATPVLNMASVAILFFLDESQKMKHEDVELSWDMKRANRRHFKAMARARLKLQTKQLNFLVTELDRAVCSPESLRAIQQTAVDLNTTLLGQLSGGRTYASAHALSPAPATPALPSPDNHVSPSEAKKLDESAVSSAPVPGEEKPGMLDAATSKLKGFFGGSGEGEAVSLAQTATVQAPAPVPASKPARKSKASAPAVKSAASRVCSECSQSFTVKNAKQQTCSDTCRKARTRRLRKEKKA